MTEQVTEEKYVPLVATPLKHGEPPIVLDEEMYQSLLSLLSSTDEENHKLAQLSLNTCDTQKSIYWIWKLAKYYSNNMVNLRTKASRAFRSNTNLFIIAWKDPTNFIIHLNDKGWLTEEIYQRLEKDIIKEAINKTKNKFFDVVLIIKDNYKHLATINEVNVKEYESNSNK